MDRHDSRIQFNEERLREISAQNTNAIADITQAEDPRRVPEEELGVVSGNLANSEASLEEHRASLASKQAAVQKVEESLRQTQEALRQAQADAFAAAQDLTRVRNEITALDLQKQGNVVRLEKLSAEKIQLEEERNRLESRLSEFTADVAAKKLNATTKRGTVEERQQRLAEIQIEMNQAGAEQDRALEQQAEKRSRLNVLEQLQADHEGFGAGSLAALTQSQHVLGSLADKIRVPEQFVTAIETALGHHLQLVLTDQPEAAREILADLSANKKGRASVAPLSLTQGATVEAQVSNEQPNGHSDSPSTLDTQPSSSDHTSSITNHARH